MESESVLSESSRLIDIAIEPDIAHALLHDIQYLILWYQTPGTIPACGSASLLAFYRDIQKKLEGAFPIHSSI